jgi:hypothetical protein
MTSALEIASDLNSAHVHRTSSPSYPLEMSVLSADAWHAAVADFDEVTQEQLHAFAYNRGGYSVVEPVLFRRKGEVIGGALMTVRHLPLRVAALAQSNWGPMLRRRAGPDASANFALMADTIRREYGDRRRMVVSLRIPPWIGDGDNRFAALEELGFRTGETWDHPALYTLDVRQPDDALRANLNAKWRNHLKRAQSSNLTFEVAGADGLAQMQQLYDQMLERKQFEDRTAYHTLPALMDLAPNLRPRIFLVRDAAGVAIAGAVSFVAGELGWYLYGATSDAALTVNAGHFLQWNIARWVRDNSRAKWYCLGGTDGVAGLTTFKTGLAGKNAPQVLVPPTADYASGLRARAVGAAAFAVQALLAARRRSKNPVSHD